MTLSFSLGGEALSKLDEQLTCAICLERYTDPRSLPCLHIYCKDCINRLEKRQHVVRCPTCRQPTRLSEKGASTLPTSFHTGNLLELEETLKKTRESSLVRLCHAHGNKPMDLYCETCEGHICFKCSLESHSGHRWDYADNLFTTHKEQIEASLQSLKNQINEVEFALTQFDKWEREMRDQEQVVQMQIDEAYRNLIHQLQESRRKLSQKAAAALQEKLLLHSLQRENVEAVLMQLKGCHDFVEQEVKSRSQHLIQAAKEELVKRINNSYSGINMSQLLPAQEPIIMFSVDKNTTCCIGDVSSNQSYSCPRLFSVNIPPVVVEDKQEEVTLTAPVSLSTDRLCCQLTTCGTSNTVTCPVIGIGEGQYKVTIQSSTAGLHQLRVLVDEVNVYGSPFTVHVVKWKRQNLVRFAKGFSRPVDVAVTDDGKHVVVAEYDGHCVTVLSSTGKVVKKFGSLGSEPGKFQHPCGIAASADNIFVVGHSKRIQKFAISSMYKASHDQYFTGVAVNPTSGKALCIKHNRSAVDVLNSDLTPSYSFETSASPSYLAVDTKGMVYVTDPYKAVVIKMTSEGKHIATIGSKGEQLHQFSEPRGICIDSNDIMYVTDSYKHRVMVFTTESKFLGSFSRSDKLIRDPRGIAVDKAGNVYVCDASSGKLLVSRPSN